MAHGSPVNLPVRYKEGLAAAPSPRPSLQYASFVSGTLTLDFGRPLFRVQLNHIRYSLRKLV